MARRQSVFEYLKECALRPDATRESVLAEIERTTSSEFNYLAVGSRVRMAVLRDERGKPAAYEAQRRALLSPEFSVSDEDAAELQRIAVCPRDELYKRRQLGKFNFADERLQRRLAEIQLVPAAVGDDLFDRSLVQRCKTIKLI